MATTEATRRLQALAAQLRGFNRPDARSEAFFETSMDELSQLVHACRTHLPADAAEELLELYSCYCHTPFCEFESNEQERRECYVEDHLLELLQDMERLTGGGKESAVV